MCCVIMTKWYFDSTGEENIALSKTEDGSVTVRAEVNYTAMIRFAKTFAPEVKVLAPVSLVDDVKSELEKALRTYPI